MIVIALGGNLTSDVGPPEKTIPAALYALTHFGINLFAVSPLYATRAWPDPNDPIFTNAAARLETALSPEALMGALSEVETKFGRIRTLPNAPRTLDIDLLDYNGTVRALNPTLPHPRLEKRGFVLVPLQDVAPDWRHPISGKAVGELIAALPEQDRALRRLPQIST